MRRAAILAPLLALPAVAAAQAFDGSRPVDAFTGPLVASSRITGLGGAYVAVAEGLEGAPVNPAAVAQRNPRLASGWDWDWLLTWYVPDAGQLGRQDLGNDGGVDAGLSGAGNGQVGLSYQRGRVGLAAYGGGWNLAAPRTGVGSVEMEIAEGSLAAGGTFRRDEVVVGGSITSVAGVARVVAAPGAVPGAVEYGGSALRLGALWRPRGSPWRLGAAFRAEGHALPEGDRAALPVATPPEFVFPWVLSLGAARWFGPNAARTNEPPRVELARHPEWGPGPAWQDTRARPVLVVVQLDVVGPTPGAVSIESALVPSATALASGEHASLVVRAGAEWEPAPERVRVRGGSYLEPSRTGAPVRPHVTFGADVRVPFPWRALRLGLAGDVAARFRNVSVSVGFWPSLGPAAPPVEPNPS